MPHVAFHALIAQRLVDHWRMIEVQLPFDPLHPTVRNALTHGALGPDMGLFPGGDRLLSAVVHRMRSGQLARALLATAATDAQRAYAWGWLTHIIADTRLHPAINRAAAHLLGREQVRYDDPRQETAHVRVEFGIDAACIAREPELLETRVESAFDRDSVRWLADALRTTYGPLFPDTVVLRSHLAVVRYHHIVLSMAASVAHRWYGRPRPGGTPLAHRPVFASARPVVRRLAPDSKLAALLDPVRPAPTLEARVREAEHELPTILEHHRRTRLALLPDHDLETGGIEDPARPTAGVIAMLRALAGRRATVSRATGALAEA